MQTQNFLNWTGIAFLLIALKASGQHGGAMDSPVPLQQEDSRLNLQAEFAYSDHAYVGFLQVRWFPLNYSTY